MSFKKIYVLGLDGHACIRWHYAYFKPGGGEKQVSTQGGKERGGVRGETEIERRVSGDNRQESEGEEAIGGENREK